MFRPLFLGHYQVVSLIQGNCAICDIELLIFNEISFSSIKSYCILYHLFFKISNVKYIKVYIYICLLLSAELNFEHRMYFARHITKAQYT
jgi:hypothetical protein